MATDPYKAHSAGYAQERRPDPRIASCIRTALAGCRSLVNIGAGAGSYEPTDLDVIAVEPSWSMLAQRVGDSAPVIQGRAERLPLGDGAVDAALAVLTLLPGIQAWDQRRFPTLEQLRGWLGPLTVQAVPVPADCVDGFLGAYWRRPWAYLDAQVRSGMSCAAKFNQQGLERLRCDFASGVWEQRHGHLLDLDELDIGYRLVIAHSNDGAIRGQHAGPTAA